MSERALTAEDLSIGYGKEIVAAGIGFSLSKGEITVVIGPNGAGKSTLLKTVAGELPALSGHILLGKKELTAMKGTDRAKALAVMPTGLPVTSLTTCREIVAAGRYPYTGLLGVLSAEDEERVDEAMVLTETTGFGSRDFSLLSDGQKQRVLLARALSQEPEVLLLDEPVTFLDLRGKISFLTMLRAQAAAKKIAVLMTMHELTFAKAAADHIIGLRDGRIFLQGDPKELLNKEKVCALYGLDVGIYERYLEDA